MAAAATPSDISGLGLLEVTDYAAANCSDVLRKTLNLLNDVILFYIQKEISTCLLNLTSSAGRALLWGASSTDLSVPTAAVQITLCGLWIVIKFIVAG